MTTINKSILSALLSHVNPWGTRPDIYGDNIEGYNASARLASAGTTWQELHGAGVALQSDTHGRGCGLPGWRDLPAAEKDRRNRNYRLAHGATLVTDTRINAEYRNPDGMYAVGGAAVDSRVNPETCPSGLRPRIIRAHHKSDNLRLWHQLLVQAVAATPDGGMVTIPDLDSLGGVPSVSTGEKTTTRVSGPTGYKAFVGLRDALAVTLSNLIANLRSAEDLSVCGPAADAFATWAFTAPTDKLDGVRPDHYDQDIIREGSVVVLVSNAKATPAVAFMAKISKVEVPETLVVSRIDGAVCYVTAQNFKKDLPVPTTELRRWTPPQPVVAAAWKPSVGALASLGGIMVLVNSITETEAQVTDEEGNDATVSIADLTAPE